MHLSIKWEARRKKFSHFFNMSAPRSSIKLPAKKFGSDGKITNWSALWPEAKELESLVIGGFVDNLTTAQVLNKYPHFGSKFSYKPFSSALTNIRKKFNKELEARASYDNSGGECKCSYSCYLRLCRRPLKKRCCCHLSQTKD